MIKILFVCLGNICRSPAAEGIMKSLIEKEGLQDKVMCDSAATSSYEIGNPADPRMVKHARKRGYNLTSIARKISPTKDFAECDYILAMDNSNYRDIAKLQTSPDELKGKLFKMCDFCSPARKEKEVPDPWYGGPEGFELVLDILEDACAGLLVDVKRRLEL